MPLDGAPSPRKQKGTERPPDVPPLGMRESVVVLKQILNLMATAAAVPPPSGVSTAEVQRRVGMLQSVLDPMREHVEAMQLDRKLNAYNHLIRVHQQRMQAEEKGRRENAELEKYKSEREKSIRDSKFLYHRSLSGAFIQKASQCRTRNDKALAEIIAKGEEAENNRACRLERLKNDRAMKQLELKRRHAESMQRIRSVNSRCYTEKTLDQLRKEQEAEIRAAEVEAKLDFVRKSRISAVAAKGSNEHGSKNSTDTISAKPHANSKTYEQLQKELETKHSKQQERYAEQKAAQIEYQNMRLCHVANRRLKQKANALRLIEEKISHNGKIMENLHEKMSRIDQLKESQTMRCKKMRENTIADIEMHKLRADQLESKRKNDILNKNFRRWNSRGACILGNIKRVLYADEIENTENDFWFETDPTAASNTRKPFVRIPSPSEFAV